MLSAIRFLWNATRGHRLQPWRSEYLKWRIETYSGMKAEEITPRDMARFVWREKWQLMHFLKWTGDLEKYAAAGRDS
jgi:hypothetical protein